MSDGEFQVLDLFGAPLARPLKALGRPRHEPTENDRRCVRELRAGGLSHVAIARAMGITPPTLRLNYFQELGSASQTWRRRLPEGENR